MKGYFSRIAKQSGLRYSRGAMDERRSPISESASKTLAPIDVDETVMVEPAPSKRRVTTQRDEPSANVMSEPQARRASPKNITKIDQPITQERPVEALIDAEKKQHLNPKEPVKAAPHKPKKRAIGNVQKASRQEKSLAEPVIEQTTFEETRGELQSDSAEPASRKNEPLEDSSIEKSVPAAEKKNYFAKTAEIIERGDVPAEEIQQIIFREVQQWVADSPDETEVSEIVVEETAPQITKQIVRSSLEQTKFVTEQPAQQDLAKEQIETKNSVAEETFELSIGTINVVVEDEKPKQPEPPSRANTQNTATTDRREFSRLSRHYL